MDYLRKATERMMQSVGLAEKVPDDNELAQTQQRLKLLFTTVQSMHRSMNQYATSMCMVGEAARTLSDDISKFYNKSQKHTKMVGAFIDASLDQESNALLLFKEQFGDDIDHHFDEWLNEIRTNSDRLRTLFEHHVELFHLKQKLEIGQRTPGTYHSDITNQVGPDGIRCDLQYCNELEKGFLQEKSSLITSVNNLLATRYERFDVVFIRLMEFQKDFFSDGLEVTEQFAPIVDTYRQNNKIVGGSSSIANKEAATSPMSSPKEPQQQQQQQQPQPQRPTPQPTRPAPQPPQQPQQQQQSTAPTPPANSPKQPEQQPPQQQKQQQQKEMNLFDLDFGSASPSTPATPSTQSQQKAAPAPSSSSGGDVFDLFGGSASSTTPQQPKPQNNNAADLLGDMFAPSSTQQRPNSQQQSQSSLEDFFSTGSSTASTPKPTPKTSGNTAAYSDFDQFLGGSSSKSTTGNNNNGAVDDIDDDTQSKPKPSASSSSSSSSNDLFGGFSFGGSSSSSSNNNNFSSFDPLGPSTSAPAKTSSYQPQPEEPQGPQLSQSEEKEQIQNHKQNLEQRLEQWRYRHGQERDIQGLLSSLHTILWAGHTWKKVDTTALLDYSSVKKTFRRALLTVHPDKVSQGTPEMKATADLVFEVLNNAFKRYEVAQGLRSA